MIIDTKSEVYRTIRTNFYLRNMSYSGSHSFLFSVMLDEYGAVIQRSAHNGLIHDWLGISPGYDTIVFSDEEQFTLFTLKWL